MDILLKLDEDFQPDVSEHATVNVFRAPDDTTTPLEGLGTVTFNFTEGADADQHTIEIVLPGMVHYMQAKVIYEASMMVDIHFAPDAREPYHKVLIEA